MRPWLRYGLYSLATLLLIVLLGALWLVRSIDGERLKRVAADWMLAQHDRTLVFEGPACEP